MIQEADPEDFRSLLNLARKITVGFAWGRVARGMVVHEDKRIRARQDRRPKDFSRMGHRLIQAADADEMIADSARLRVEQNRRQVLLVRFVTGIVRHRLLLELKGGFRAVQSKLTKGHSAVLTPQRKALLCNRWNEDFQQDINAWKHYCEVIGSSDFCLGRIKGKGCTIDLSWAIESSEHVPKSLEGGFSGGNHPSKLPACHVPELAQVWEAVLFSFHRKHGKPTCRSWLDNAAFARLQRHGSDGPVVTLRCPSRFARDWIDQRYLPDLKRWFGEATKDDARITDIELIVEKGE